MESNRREGKDKEKKDWADVEGYIFYVGHIFVVRPNWAKREGEGRGFIINKFLN
jgi:hypothetical protein